ncbi:hypothetical protein [Paenibacillus rhizoplanae]|uniref:hypothetical protein n=1 Tax=Paenibacillus rhizoplanae TaxID=1917181 RepID=UPI003617BFD6
MEFKIIDGTEYISINRAADYFDVATPTLKQNMMMMGISVIKHKKVDYMCKDDFEEAYRLGKSMVGLKDIITECMSENDDITFDYLSRVGQSKYQELHSFFAGLNYFGIKVKYRLISKSYNPIVFFINRDDKEQFKSNIVLKLKLYNKTKEEKLRILLEDDFFSINRKTKTALIKLAKDSPANMQSSINELANFLRLTCNKEISQFNDDEITTYMELATDNITKNGNIQFTKLISIIKENEECSFSIHNQFDKHVGVTKRENHAYEDSVYLKLAYMVFNEEHWIENDMLLKASNSKPIATTWLYHAMHYGCAWRKSDIVQNIPHITLNIEPEEIIRKVKEHDYNDTTWIPYVDELVVRVGFEIRSLIKQKGTIIHCI